MNTLNVTAQKAKPQPAKLIEVAQFGRYQPIGLGITKTGRTFVTFPQRQPFLYGLAELVNGKRVAYPDTEWNKFDTLHAENHFMNVQAAWPDGNDHLWVLDPANPNDGPAIAAGVKLVDINLATNQVERIYRFEDLDRSKIALNDVRIDNKRLLAYISEPKTASVIVLDLQSGKSRMVLTGKKYTKADPDFKLHLDGKDVIDQKGKPFSSGVNGIALTHDGEWFYFRAINQPNLYRIAAADLANSVLTDAQLEQKVQWVAKTGVSHGMLADAKGNIYLSDSPNKAIKYVTPSGELKTLVTDSRLSWPDTFAIGGDGYLYVTCSQLNRGKKYNDGVDKTEFPYRLFKVKLP